jgi:hypothetical protein
MPINWNQDQPIVKYLKTWIPKYFPIVPINHPAGDGVGGYVPRKTRSGGFSAHSQGRAADIYLDASDPEQLALGNALFGMFRTSAALLGTDHIIWNRGIWSVASGGPRKYTGPNGPHTNHVHVAFSQTGSQLQPPILLTLLDNIHAQFYGRRYGQELLSADTECIPPFAFRHHRI